MNPTKVCMTGKFCETRHFLLINYGLLQASINYKPAAAFPVYQFAQSALPVARSLLINAERDARNHCRRTAWALIFIISPQSRFHRAIITLENPRERVPAVSKE